jgi:hypothetical protein
MSPRGPLFANDEPTEREKQQVIDFARRKAKPRFYADENFPQLATGILRRRLKADVLTVQDARRRGHPDENHAAEALRLGRVLITCDRYYLDERRFPLIHCPALVVFDFARGTAGEIWETFKCLGAIFSAPQSQGSFSFEGSINRDSSKRLFTKATCPIAGSSNTSIW